MEELATGKPTDIPANVQLGSLGENVTFEKVHIGLGQSYRWYGITLLPECQSEIIQLHPDLTSCDISIKK